MAIGCQLQAIGRYPNTDGLGLDRAGVARNEVGAVKVDSLSMSSVDNIYAIGDVTDRVNLTPVAIREGHAFADTVYGGRLTKVDHEDIPTAVFSQPEIGTVGLTEAAARIRYPKVDVYKSRFRPLKHTLTGRDETMLMKLVVEAESTRVLGCHILGPDAGEMAQLLGIAVREHGVLPHPDPTCRRGRVRGRGGASHHSPVAVRAPRALRAHTGRITGPARPPQRAAPSAVDLRAGASAGRISTGTGGMSSPPTGQTRFKPRTRQGCSSS